MGSLSTPTPGNASSTGAHCPAYNDGFLTWPRTPNGTVAWRPCLDSHEDRAYRVCHSSGRWLAEDGHPAESINKSYSNYSGCFSTFSNQFLDGKSVAEIKMIDTAVRVNEILEIIGDVLSSLSLAIAVAIFCCYSSLSSVRNKIHRNLFIAMLMQILGHLLLATREIVTSRTSMRTGNAEFLSYACTGLKCIWETTRTSIFAWMLIEGINIHSKIAGTVFQTTSGMCRNYLLGYGLPIVPTAVWATVVATRKQQSAADCWKDSFHSADYWILNACRLTTFAINMVLLLNVLRVLVMRLRENRSNEIMRIRKALRAALLLLPLLGITNAISLVPDPINTVRFIVVTSLKSFLLSFQGLFLALMYCFLSKEVQAALHRSLNRHRIQRGKESREHRLGGRSTFVVSGVGAMGGSRHGCREPFSSLSPNRLDDGNEERLQMQAMLSTGAD